MRISQTGPVQRAQRITAKRQNGQGDGFASAMEAAPETAAQTTGLAPVASLAGLLGAQEVDDREIARRRGKDRGEALLDQLEALRRDLLLGVVPRSRLEAIARKVSESRPAFEDPRLAAILDDIELRALVELAKLGQAPG